MAYRTSVVAALTVAAVLLPLAARAADAPQTVELRYMNRTVHTMRVPVSGVTPEERAERALRRLRALPVDISAGTIETVPVWRNGERAVALKFGSETLLTVFQGDVDADTGATVDEVAAAAARILDDALAARLALHEPRRVVVGAAVALSGIPVVLAVAWLDRRLRGALAPRLQRIVQAEAATHRIFGMDWSAFGLRGVAVTMRGLGWLAVGVLGFLWVGHALRQFPATVPLADEMREFLADGAFTLTSGVWNAMPDLAAISVILVCARALAWIVDQVFTAVGAGTLRLPGVHRETAKATRRLVVFGIWGLALVAVYPFIPGSDSAVFRGLSVFLGAMFTLGSSGVVSQWMHGLVVVYARALRVGDSVRCGEHEGVVVEIGALSVKIVDARGDEVTLPNGTVVQGAIVNHSRRAPQGTVRGAVRVSLGYDVPWREAHALLRAAAERTPGVRSQPAPTVRERAFGDMTVDYELVVWIESAQPRPAMMAALMRCIRDVFDAAGVGIVSPQLVSFVEALSHSSGTPRSTVAAGADESAAATRAAEGAIDAEETSARVRPGTARPAPLA